MSECVVGCDDDNQFIHYNIQSGNAWWDMRTENNQEVAPGLYLFHVEQLSNDGDIKGEQIGKFAIVR